MPYIFYRISEAIESDNDGDEPYIIAHEKLKFNGEVGRYYIVFDSYDEFIEARDDYPNAHELLVTHKKNTEKTYGRLIFDFDIDKKYYDKKYWVHPNFKKQVEENIIDTVNEYYANVNTDNIIFIWSTTNNEKKFSKHLTVKGLCFDNWVQMSKVFYELFSLLWDEKHLWIGSDKLFDKQVARRGGSMRMVGSSKIGGKMLTLDDDFAFEDSLIRPVVNVDDFISHENYNIDKIEKDLELSFDEKTNTFVKGQYENIQGCEVFNVTTMENIVDTAFNLINSLSPNVFAIGKFNSNCVSLFRHQPAPCIISGKYHENENAYMIITKFSNYWSVRYGCYRNCGSKKTVSIANIIDVNGVYKIQYSDFYAKRNN